jgi:hypothetical protein
MFDKRKSWMQEFIRTAYLEQVIQQVLPLPTQTFSHTSLFACGLELPDKA